jgi:4-amino-4-deoxy-L-arabinose transferase-like glycosyltransferase
VKTALILIGGAALVAPVLAGGLRTADGFPTPFAAFLLAVGLAFLGLGLAAGTRWQPTAGFIALALVTQASLLQMIDAGPFLRVQHLASIRLLLTSPRGLYLVVLAVNTVVLLVLARRVRTSLLRDLWQALRGYAWLVVAAGWLFASAIVMLDSPRQYAAEVAVASWAAGLSLLDLTLAASLAPRTTAWWLASFLGRLRARPWIVAAWTTGACILVSVVVYDRIPKMVDEVQFLFMGKYLSRGLLYLPSPPDQAAFQMYHAIDDGQKWYGISPPGWPAALAIGVRLGWPWIVNPLLAGAAILLTYRLLATLYSPATAVATIALLSLSPQVLFLSASFMPHAFALVCALVACLGMVTPRRPVAWGVAAGVGLGLLAMTRPLEAVLVGTTLGIWTLTRLDRRAVARLAAVAAGSLPFGVLALAYNRTLTGSATYDPLTKSFDENYYPGSNRLGFGPDVGNVGWGLNLDPLPGHGLPDLILNANQNAYMLNFELFGWGFGSLLLAAIFVCFGRRARADWLFLGLAVAVVSSYSLYWFSGGPDYGARYWYQAVVPAAVLSVRGLEALARRLRDRGAPALRTARLPLVVALASAVGFVTVVPWRATDKYHQYDGVRPDIRTLNREHHFGRSVVIVQDRIRKPWPDYGSAAIFNPPTLDGDTPIYVRGVDPAGLARVLQHFADRPVWFVAGPSITGGRMRVVAGPLPPLSSTPPDGPRESRHPPR